jgi:hypothetical protein
MVHAIRLSSSCTVEQYERWEAARDRTAIANFLIERFEERYFVPIDHSGKHGFTIMAICCLSIEAIESFARGWAASRGKSKLAFCSYFSKSENLAIFRPHSEAFYKHIRCGILHQAETTGGWRIRRSGSLLSSKTINATRFLACVRGNLHAYATSLKEDDWNADPWKNVRMKMAAICSNVAA